MQDSQTRVLLPCWESQNVVQYNKSDPSAHFACQPSDQSFFYLLFIGLFANFSSKALIVATCYVLTQKRVSLLLHC